MARRTDPDGASRKGAPLIPMPPDETYMATSSALLHELNESLTAIENYARGAQHLAAGRGSGDPAQLRGALERLIGQVHRAADAMQRLRSLLDPRASD